MTILVHRTVAQTATANLATDLARYGSTATWRGVYYRGEKIGFTVSQTIKKDDGFELEEDGRLQMLLLGSTTAATLHTVARVDEHFRLRSFEFLLDPGTGSIHINGRVTDSNGTDRPRLVFTITSSSGTRTEEREIPDVPVLSQNLTRLLASGGLIPGSTHQWTVLDPATLTNAPVVVHVGNREVIPASDGIGAVPAFRVEMEFSGLRTTSWMTDTGEVMREESPLGMITVRESPERARAMAVPWQMRGDLLKAAAIIPAIPDHFPSAFEGRDVRHLRVTLTGADLSALDLQGTGQTLDGTTLDIRDPRSFQPSPTDREASRYLAPEPFIESDAPEIVAEAERAIRGATSTRNKAEKLTRYVNALLEKKPTVSLPSAREVLRTKVGDCNEHTALFVAMARAAGIPARINVGLVYVHGAFFYHAWPEVYLREGTGDEAPGFWLPVDPTLNEFPADATHIRLARGGLAKQAVILPLIGQLKMTVDDLELTPGAIPVLIGRERPPDMDLGSIALPIPSRQSGACCRCAAPTPTRSRLR